MSLHWGEDMGPVTKVEAMPTNVADMEPLMVVGAEDTVVVVAVVGVVVKVGTPRTDQITLERKSSIC
jgi:hypothetical protein